MIASIPNIIGWLAISFAKVSQYYCLMSLFMYQNRRCFSIVSINTIVLSNNNLTLNTMDSDSFKTMMFFILLVNLILLGDIEQDSSFLYMGRLLEGFGVGVISYTVRNLFFSELFVLLSISSSLIYVFLSSYDLGSCLHSWNCTPEHERGSWRCQSGTFATIFPLVFFRLNIYFLWLLLI